MKYFKIKVIELHECEREYYVKAKNKTEAREKAIQGKHNSEGVDYFSTIRKVEVKNIEELKGE